MAEPPASPPSSDIAGIDKDLVRRDGGPTDPDQQNKLAKAGEEGVARPVYDPQMEKEGSPQ